MKKIVILLTIIVCFSSAAFSKDYRWGLNIGKNYSNRYTTTTGDTKNFVSRTIIGIKYISTINDNYSIGLELSSAIDDAVVSSVSTATYGDILTNLSLLHEFQTKLGIININTGLYSLYYFRRNPGSANNSNPINSFSWADIGFGYSHKISPVFNINIKVEPLFWYLLVNQTNMPFTITLESKF